jgi:hypothetical protein
MKYIVSTRDVDGSTRRVRKTLAGAVARFESMYGHPIDSAIADHFWNREALPKIEDVTHLRAVSDFGTVVEFDKVA